MAGVVALIRARYPAYTPQQVVNRLFTRSTTSAPGYENRYGYGRVNAYRALGASVRAPGVEWRCTGANSRLRRPRASVGHHAAIAPSRRGCRRLRRQGAAAGRLDVRVTGVVDTRTYPWNGSGLPSTRSWSLHVPGVLIKRVDAEWEGGRSGVGHGPGRTRILVRILNYYATGIAQPIR